MKMTFHDIYNYFKNQSLFDNIFESLVEYPLIEAKLIVKNQKQFKNNIIYVGTTSFIMKNEIYLENACFVLIEDSNGDFAVEKFKNSTYIILKNTCDLFDVFNEINDMFNENALINSLENNNGLESIAKISSQILDNPLVIIDSSYRILASSEVLKIKDEFWINNIKKGYCSYDFIAYVRNMESIKTSLDNKTPFPVTCDASPIKRWVTKIFIHGKLAGYIVVLLSNSPIDERDKKILPIISNVTAKALEKSFVNRNLENMDYENLFMDLLESKIQDGRSLKEKLKSYYQIFEMNFIIIVLDINNFDATDKVPSYLSSKIDNIFYKKIHIYYENYIVILYDFKNEPFSFEQLEKVKSFAKKNKILLGVSNNFNDLLNSRKYFDQATMAIKMDEKIKNNKIISNYKDVQFYDFLYRSNKLVPILDFIHPCLNILKLYDEKNNSDLYNTLYIYLKNEQNSVFTAKELFIHRNTVKYRLDKIIEETHIDLMNKEETFQILFSYKAVLFLMDK